MNLYCFYVFTIIAVQDIYTVRFSRVLGSLNIGTVTLIPNHCHVSVFIYFIFEIYIFYTSDKESDGGTIFENFYTGN